MLGDDEGMSGCLDNPNKAKGEFSSIPSIRFPRKCCCHASTPHPPSAPLLRGFYSNWVESQVFLLIIAQKAGGNVPVSEAATARNRKRPTWERSVISDSTDEFQLVLRLN